MSEMHEELFTAEIIVETVKSQIHSTIPNLHKCSRWDVVDRYMSRIFLYTQKKCVGLAGGNQIRSDTFQNGSDIIRYPNVILSHAVYSDKFVYSYQ